MCTSFTYQDAAQHWYLARTMDFAFELDGRPVVIPRHHQFQDFTTKYGFVGAGRKIDEYITVDGVNEHGLGAASLYLNESQYSDKPVAGKTNLASYDVVSYLLGTFTSVADVRAALSTLNVTAKPNSFLNIVVPLHWIIADGTGAIGVLEQAAAGLRLYDDPVGVMTNSPEFPWHLTNLQNYPQLTNRVAPQTNYGTLVAAGHGAGTGAAGLPGDYTSVSRFVRMAFMRQHAEVANGEASAINTLAHLTDTVNIPKNLKLMNDGSSDYSQYRGYCSLNTHTYYFQPYNDSSITRVQLNEDLLNASQPTEYLVNQTQQFVEAN